MKSVLVASALLFLLSSSGSARSQTNSCGEAPVQIPVSVINQAGNSIPNLAVENFTVTEDGQPQRICRFTSNDDPWTIGFILDNSGSTARHLDWELASATGFVKFANPQNQYFVMGASHSPGLIADFTVLSQQLVAALGAVQSGHSTALLDAISMSIEKMKGAKYSRKTLIVLSDGGDNSSTHSENDVRSALHQSFLQVYFIGSPNRDLQTVEEGNGIHEMQDLTSDSGGVMMPVMSGQESAQAGAAVSMLLRHQYLLAYNSAHTHADRKWHKVKVTLLPMSGLPHATVYAPAGYYGATR
jgi:Ca-activated chloride channel family protein